MQILKLVLLEIHESDWFSDYCLFTDTTQSHMHCTLKNGQIIINTKQVGFGLQSLKVHSKTVRQIILIQTLVCTQSAGGCSLYLIASSTVLVSFSSLGLEQIVNPPTVGTPGIKKSTLV